MGSADFAPFRERLRSSEPFQALIAGPASARRLPAAAAAWVADLLAEERGRRILAVVPHESEALAWRAAARTLAGPGRVQHFPAPRLSPYHESAAAVGESAQLVEGLVELVAAPPAVVVATPRMLARRLPRREDLLGRVLELAVGAAWEIPELVARLEEAGFHRVDLVTEVGDYAVRGGVIDLYGPAGPPLRIDFDGDTIESLRAFAADTQRSLEHHLEARVLPLATFPPAPADRELAPRRPDAAFAEARAIAAAGSVGLPDWLGLHDVVLYEPAAVERALRHAWDVLSGEHAALIEQGRTLPPPEVLEHAPEPVLSWLQRPHLAIGEEGAPGAGAVVDFGATSTDVFHRQLARFGRDVAIARDRGEQVVLAGRAEARPGLEDFCRGLDLPLGSGGVAVVEGGLPRGFRLPAAGIALYAESQLFVRPPVEARARQPGVAAFLPSVRDLRVGDYVVHRDHGIGQLVELAVLRSERPAGGPVPGGLADLRAEMPVELEALRIEYAEGQSLLLPLDRIELLQKYSGIEGVRPRLDRLGGTSWAARQSRVREGLRKLAVDLVRLYAERQLAQAPPMPGGGELQARFAAGFEFEETPDQLAAAAAIREDLERSLPMDRLLAGDVGFGKTEVAMRAALQVVEAGYQVAVLAPTTILADQHLETFRRRFEGLPVTIDMLSRFRSAAEARDIRQRVEEGRIDILIGTHRLLSRDVRIPRLGLLIVDEEQRFGVAQKERFRDLQRSVHALAMSATPVPRTLQLSLAGVRDLSVIETPPRDRMAVETAVLPISDDLLREAIEHELDRGGQVYLVHNRVQDIEEVAAWVRRLVPEARLTIGHGQLDERELARRMHAFQAGDFDVLLATTIIENGIDIPRVNTMLIHHAERFGLAQLYQLRGRVGRSTELAYCYLLVPAGRALTEEARQRLDVIRDFTELGSGFRIAARDLEIRGAGNLLGAEQSGHIAAVGIETYLKLLDEAVRTLRDEPVEELVSANVDLPVDTRIPAAWVAEAPLRMEIYQRAAAAGLEAPTLLAELEDRYGPAPPAVHHLLELAALKARAERLRVQAITASRRQLQLRLRQDARVDVDRLIEFVAITPGARFSPGGVLTLDEVDPATMLQRAADVLAAVQAEELEVHAPA